MKKFKYIFIGMIGVYVTLAIGLFLLMNGMEQNLNNRYRISIHRIADQVNSDVDFTSQLESMETSAVESSVESMQTSAAESTVESMTETSEYEYETNKIYDIDRNQFTDTEDIISIQYLSVDADDLAVIRQFYSAKNDMQFEIVPVIQEQFIGYLRFDYKKHISYQSVIIVAEISLLIMFSFLVCILCYMNRNILHPFQTFSEVPYELSRGNLNLTVKESKNRYFGKFIWGIGMLKDTLEEHNKKELKLSKEKKMLLLTISHDIKTPLNAIGLYAQALENGLYQTNEQQKDAICKIEDKVEEINEFVKEIIKSSTEDIITIEVDRDASFYIQELQRRVKQGYTEKCKLRHLTFQVEDTDNKLIQGDADRIYEALGNLIENALKYGDGQKIIISFTEEEYCQLIHVYNSGIPVDASEMPHLFESFFRGTNVEGKQGNGLGLYICREIMLKMNGDIYAYRHKDGMEFVLVCPIA